MNALSIAVTDQKRWHLVRDVDILAQHFTWADICSGPTLGHSPEAFATVCKLHRANTTSPRSPVGANVPPSCALNNQQGHAKPKVAPSELALREKFDDSDLVLGFHARF